ncbi:MAG TPA: glutamine-hydrolyzing carbamoyl-phosphate synthase small subunit [Candidatus Tectomicrobia bacterium]|nr:glutamine-hydrolyzing carbamoyl-phosphate synthase small subunit [Candidatus Tectomicrobia bacterium]
MPQALLALEDGTVFWGKSFGTPGETFGEVVFNTNLTGYQEVLTDPSYKGQIVAMTNPLMGNYGVNEADLESRWPQVEGFIIKEGSKRASNWRAQYGLEEWLQQHGVVGIQGLDTRALTRHLRTRGAMRGAISTSDLEPDSLIARVRASPGLIGRDLVCEVTCDTPYTWTAGEWHWPEGYVHEVANLQERFRVVAYDFGIKRNILRKLVQSGCDVTVVPAHTTAAEALQLNPDGIFLSNGPGDPEGVPYAIEAVRQLIGVRPIFGICLGHQILGLAFGGKTYKLKFGHRGGNQPVMHLPTQKVEITSQNHGFTVDAESLPTALEVTHLNLNDRTVEGMRHRDLPVFSVQYHPEASPGPHDSWYLFERFRLMLRESVREVTREQRERDLLARP